MNIEETQARVDEAQRLYEESKVSTYGRDTRFIWGLAIALFVSIVGWCLIAILFAAY